MEEELTLAQVMEKGKHTQAGHALEATLAPQSAGLPSHLHLSPSGTSRTKIRWLLMPPRGSLPVCISPSPGNNLMSGPETRHLRLAQTLPKRSKTFNIRQIKSSGIQTQIYS